MEPVESLRSIEIALRLVIKQVLGEEDWLQARGAPDAERLTERQVEEAKRRDGAVVSDDLIDYTEAYHLTGIVEKNWDRFQSVFKDKARTLAYFGVLEDVRNSIAHSRDLVPFERDLLSGIAGQFRNQISLFRGQHTPSSAYYPLIESVVDSFGREGLTGMPYFQDDVPRLDVGDVIRFSGRAFDAKKKGVIWEIKTGYIPYGEKVPVFASGDTVEFDYVVTEDDVSESFVLSVRIRTDGRFHRENHGHPYDDERSFPFSVNPPD
ncbi:hypothetical protein MED01_001737 [Micromonospora sp. MED01]|uniref:hypothetical protein n=1 Tax=Micromonospora alfalfae TaxID=2911212 RepID=UPI001EE88224|nr:hypothetical protein [Micromonospora alfalfae]MCG5463582.1 hypothetical protein [Micromonospora alfalfae]